MVIKQLQYLVALAREGHFGRAAQACNISQPTLSAAIRQLETELGVTIVERGHRFVGFTDEGRCVLDHAKRILADCDALLQDLGALRGGLTGRLRIGAIPTALPIVSSLTKPFHARHRGVTISIVSLTSQEIQRRLDGFEIEAGITYLDVEPLERIRSTPLYRERYVLLTPEAGPFAGRADAATWSEAADVPLCLLTPDMQNRRIVDSIFRSVGRQPRAEVETNSISNLWTHVMAGSWSSVVPRPLLSVFGVPAGTKALPLTEPHASRTVGVIVAAREPAIPTAAALFKLAETLDLDAALAADPLPPASASIDRP